MWMSLKELAGYAQQDAHEFFISALNNIHAGCEEQKLSNCNCIIHKTFAGLLQSNVTCLRCRNVTTTCDPMLDISLGLRPVEKKKSIKNGKLNGAERRVSSDAIKGGNTLLDCLDRYTQPEKLGQNEYSCSKCGNTFQEATKQLSIKRIPPVLSIQLKVRSEVKRLWLTSWLAF
jgi:ubiquitin carboxyl-terminal hydrolase 22/27/51